MDGLFAFVMLLLAIGAGVYILTQIPAWLWGLAMFGGAVFVVARFGRGLAVPPVFAAAVPAAGRVIHAATLPVPVDGEERVRLAIHVVVEFWQCAPIFGSEDGVANLLTATLVLGVPAPVVARRGMLGARRIKRIVVEMGPVAPGAPTRAEISGNLAGERMNIRLTVAEAQYDACLDVITGAPTKATYRFAFEVMAPWSRGEMLLTEGETYQGRVQFFGPMHELPGLAPVMVTRLKEKEPVA